MAQPASTPHSVLAAECLRGVVHYLRLLGGGLRPHFEGCLVRQSACISLRDHGPVLGNEMLWKNPGFVLLRSWESHLVSSTFTLVSQCVMWQSNSPTICWLGRVEKGAYVSANAKIC